MNLNVIILRTLGIPFDHSASCRSARPNDWHETHSETNGSYAIVDISVWWTHSRWSDSSDLLDDLLRVPELGDDLFVRH